ncbi:MBL fold metallo-hydrolase [Geminicoccus flavidas]|uniref:MBL fold metallo-hydrolase n=1 Tax=Geminicoccus flavidas TaxID=2506407 RepID=UPI001357B8A6|nr:MBL fold metallo-hydrolase [Geminicoccus flavidas]
MVTRLRFLGSGNAFTVGDGNWQSNMLIESAAGRRLLVDCGSDARLSLAEQGLQATDIDAVYVSHLHSDHIGGLEWLGFSTFFNPAAGRPRMFVERNRVARLWASSLSGSMSRSGIAKLEDYFDVESVPAEGGFEWEGQRFELTGMLHAMDGPVPLISFGLRFETGRGRFLITSDTRFEPERYGALYEWADTIFHDCETTYRTDGVPAPSGIHAHYEELKTLPAGLRAKLWLYHYQPGWRPDAEADGFRGFVAKGQSFEL